MTQIIDSELWEEFENEINKKPIIDLTPIKTNALKFAHHKAFWDKFLTEQFPLGSINKTLEKNFALWIYFNGIDINQVEEKYRTQNWSVRPLIGWIKEINEGKIKEYNAGEVYLWCKNNNRLDLGELIKDDASKFRIDEEIKLLSDGELQNYQSKNTKWVVENLIKSGGITVLGGKRATLKSWFELNQSYCVANGIDFLGKFKTNKGPVLYLDRENQFNELKVRSKLTKQGLNLNESQVFFISESYIKIDSILDLEKLEKIIVEKNIILVICDVYRRLISFDENDAKEVSKLFVDLLKPLTERTGVAIVLIHHEKKGESSGDDMDMLRGSSDLANYVDGIIQLERKGDILTVKQNKNRAGKEVEPFQVKIETDEISYFRFNYIGSVETTSNHISKSIVQWLFDNQIKSFTYTQILKHCEDLGFKKNSIVNALGELQSKGVILKGSSSRSPYTVSKDLSLGGFDG